MASIGPNMKWEMDEKQRDSIRQFFGEVVGCKIDAGPFPQMDLFRFDGGFTVGINFLATAEVLDAQSWKKAPWLEIIVDDIDRVAQALRDMGHHEFDYVDTSHLYFQGPGNIVFRLASV